LIFDFGVMRAIVIGGGHNGLAAAFYLAKAGLEPLVLEARGQPGGGAITSVLHPGFRCPTLTHETLLHRRVVRDMRLTRYGLTYLTPAVERCALRPDGTPIVLYADAARTAIALEDRSPRDVAAFLTFSTTLGRAAGVLAGLLEQPPPCVQHVSARDAQTWLSAGLRFRALCTRDAHQLLRWVSMPVADLVEESFQDELLRAAIAAPPLIGTRLGPRSAGTALLLLLREAHRQRAGGLRAPRGGPGAATAAMAAAARAVGARIEIDTPVDRILVDGDRVRGVVANDREFRAPLVLSAIDPKTTWWLAGAPEIDPAATRALGRYRASGTLAKINLALSALPSFNGIDDNGVLAGRVQIGGQVDDLERAFDAAKYRQMSEHPWLDITLPSIADPELAPPGAHVASIYAHYVPRDLEPQDWHSAKDVLLRRVMRTLEQYAPGIGSLVVEAEVITPRELQREYGLAGGHVFHGEMALDQLFGMRPVFGWSRYGTPVRGLYFCGAGTHPGGFMTGVSARLAAREAVRDLAQNASLRQ
jgi:phytoene dehydrogenase-like protein